MLTSSLATSSSTLSCRAMETRWRLSSHCLLPQERTQGMCIHTPGVYPPTASYRRNVPRTCKRLTSSYTIGTYTPSTHTRTYVRILPLPTTYHWYIRIHDTHTCTLTPIFPLPPTAGTYPHTHSKTQDGVKFKPSLPPPLSTYPWKSNTSSERKGLTNLKD